MRKPIVAGNWKMFTTSATASALAEVIGREVSTKAGVDVILCPPFPYLAVVRERLSGGSVALGAQDLYPEREGAFTGEVSSRMLLDCGCRYVIVGHSERRHILGESNAFIRRKVEAATAAGLTAILCVGETLSQREDGNTQDILDEQLSTALGNGARVDPSRLVIAYEPVWAIGTGRNATPNQAQEAHAFVRERLAGMVGSSVAAGVPLLYGGSVKPDNARVLMTQPDVDGALVGGASLVADQFLAIVKAGCASAEAASGTE